MPCSADDSDEGSGDGSGEEQEVDEDEEDSPGSGVHDDTCCVCGGAGRLLCCDGCTSACHLPCAGGV